MPGYLLLCPGQGGQHPEMLDFALATPQGRETIEEASTAVGIDIAARVRAGEGLFEPVFAQIGMVATALASWRALEPHVPQPEAVAGYSVGEVSSWGCAGSWTVTETMTLASTRARLMLAASPPDCTMVAMTGVDAAAVERLRGPAVHVAIEVERDHWILAGTRAEVDRAAQALSGAGGTAHPVSVTVPSHTPLLEPAAAALRSVIAAMGGLAPRWPVARGIDGQWLHRIEDAAEALSGAVCRPIRWRSALQEAQERSLAVCLELPPGQALTRMVLARGVREARSIADFRTIEGVARWLERAA
ncbi:MAG: acyltransferase domain-containing protein [Betaproteobacteria bacterium]|nr:acyltransferase domain-containing protein [Betaproteobacteria bacterium]